MRCLAFAALVALADAGSCHTDLDCSLNGVCEQGACRCDAPWKDGASGTESCNVLDSLPHPNDYVPAYGGPRTDTAWGPQAVTSWGGSVIKGDDGKYHLWVSSMHGGKGLSSWTYNSQIDHSVADDPMGVFKIKDTALKAEAHNASPLRARNGSYLIFHIGSAGVAHGGSGFLHTSESPDGPWRPLPGLSCNNPAPMLHNNGTWYVGCSNGDFEVYRSDDPFVGGWEHVTTMHFPPPWRSKAPKYLFNEDPFMWMDARSHWHCLAHRYDYRDGWPVNPNMSVPVLVSGHGFSLDGIDWHFNSAEQPYNASITFQNGTVQQFSTFERPHLLFNEKQQATHLINGVQAYWSPSGTAGPCDKCEARPGTQHSCVVCKTTKGIDFTYTLVTPLNVPQTSIIV